jgi:hypothetical protein
MYMHCIPFICSRKQFLTRATRPVHDRFKNIEFILWLRPSYSSSWSGTS